MVARCGIYGSEWKHGETSRDGNVPSPGYMDRLAYNNTSLAIISEMR